jgi:hypothetical protein
MTGFSGHSGQKCPPPCVPDSHILIGIRVFVKRLLLHTFTAPDTVSGLFRTAVRSTYPDTFPSLSLERGCPMSACVVDSTKRIGINETQP